METIEDLAAEWRRAERVVVLSGAGISTASNIPDFRSPGGRWERYQPVTIQAFLSDESAREEYWQYKGETWRLIQNAEPNPAHLALAELARRGRVELLVTQNVDGLHERSGFPTDQLVNIHGTDSAVVCMACGAREGRARAQQLWESGVAVPRCSCGGALKPAVISFGQGLVREDLDRAMNAAERCDLFVAVGTSLVVWPINQIFDVAAANGATTAILTASDTPYDGVCNFKLTTPVERTLPEISRLVSDA